MDSTRTVYRLLLFLHPRLFRKEFGAEMLWIFDEVRSEERMTRLFWDCLVSLARQHAKAEDAAEPPVRGFGLEISSSELTLIPILRATLLAATILLCFVTAAGRYQHIDRPTNSFPAPRIYRPTCEDFKTANVRERLQTMKARKVLHSSATF